MNSGFEGVAFSIIVSKYDDASRLSEIFQSGATGLLRESDFNSYNEIAFAVSKFDDNSSFQIGNVIHFNNSQTKIVKILHYYFQQKRYSLIYCIEAKDLHDVSTLDPVFEQSMHDFVQDSCAKLASQFETNEINKIIEKHVLFITSLLSSMNKHINYPLITLANLNLNVKLVTYHLTNSLHTCVCDRQQAYFLYHWLEPNQRILSSFELNEYNPQLYVQILKADDPKLSNFNNIEVSNWVSDTITILSQTESYLQAFICRKKFAEALHIAANVVAVMSEKLRTTGSDTLNDNQINEICTEVGINGIADLKIFLGLAKVYQSSSYQKFFKQYQTAIAKFDINPTP